VPGVVNGKSAVVARLYGGLEGLMGWGLAVNRGLSPIYSRKSAVVRRVDGWLEGLMGWGRRLIVVCPRLLCCPIVYDGRTQVRQAASALQLEDQTSKATE